MANPCSHTAISHGSFHTRTIELGGDKDHSVDRSTNGSMATQRFWPLLMPFLCHLPIGRGGHDRAAAIASLLLLPSRHCPPMFTADTPSLVRVFVFRCTASPISGLSFAAGVRRAKSIRARTDRCRNCIVRLHAVISAPPFLNFPKHLNQGACARSSLCWQWEF